MMVDDGWNTGDAYESYMGRWSRAVARTFIEWLRPGAGLHWLEVGCGTGALTSAICDLASPGSVTATDPAPSFIEHARTWLVHPAVSWAVADGATLPHRVDGFDAVASGLVLNFIPEPAQVMREMRSRLRPGGTVAAYVWRYGSGMEFLDAFWEEAVAADSRAMSLDEGRRFPLCQPAALERLFREAGLAEVQSDTLEIPTAFASFDDYWAPFLRGTGPAPSYVATMTPGARDALSNRLRQRLSGSGSPHINLMARALAVRGTA